jgi:hypothetical protein
VRHFFATPSLRWGIRKKISDRFIQARCFGSVWAFRTLKAGGGPSGGYQERTFIAGISNLLHRYLPREPFEGKTPTVRMPAYCGMFQKKIRGTLPESPVSLMPLHHNTYLAYCDIHNATPQAWTVQVRLCQHYAFPLPPSEDSTLGGVSLICTSVMYKPTRRARRTGACRRASGNLK